MHIGTSGWLYPSWRGVFYPPGLRHRDELAFVSRKVGSVEINGTFYSLQRPECFLQWAEQTPPGFLFAIKGSRFITHMKKLRDVVTPLANFFASGVLALGDQLGPILWQFPANMPTDLDRYRAFLELLPKSTREAARLAKRHDARVEGRSLVRASVDIPIRYAFEVRHEALLDGPFLSVLEEHDAALVVSDGAGRWPSAERVTASFTYVRLHGDAELYVSQYSPAALDAWALACRKWTRDGRDVFVYFDNDAKVHAPFDAIGLMDRLGVEPLARDLPPLKGRAIAPRRAAAEVRRTVAAVRRGVASDDRWNLGEREVPSRARLAPRSTSR